MIDELKRRGKFVQLRNQESTKDSKESLSLRINLTSLKRFNRLKIKIFSTLVKPCVLHIHTYLHDPPIYGIDTVTHLTCHLGRPKHCYSRQPVSQTGINYYYIMQRRKEKRERFTTSFASGWMYFYATNPKNLTLDCALHNPGDWDNKPVLPWSSSWR